MALDTKTSLATRHLSKLHFVIEFTQYQSDIKMNKKTTKDPNLASASSTKTTPKKLKELAQISVELARLVATNTSASEELLLELARHKDERVRRSVATNPSTPVKAAMAVGSQFPEDLLNNPSFNLYILAEPNLLTGIGASALRALLKREVCPDSFFAYAASQDDEATQLAILTNPRAPKSIIQQLANSPHTRVQDTAKKHVALQSTKADESSWKDGFIAELLEEEKNRDKVPEAHQSLAYFLISQVDDLSELTEHELWVVRTAWTKEDRKNSFWMPTFDFSKGNYPASILQIAAKSEDRNFRGQIAQNPNTPTPVLELMAKDEDEDVRSEVAKNPNTPTSVLELLAKEEDEYVRGGVAQNPNTPDAVKEYLWSIYINWLYKNEIPESIQITELKNFILSRLGTGLQDRVDSAKKNKELSGLRNEFITRMVAGSKPSITRCVAFLLDDCPAASLAKYQRSSWWIERCAIAQNKNVPENVLKKLLNDANLLVKNSALFSFQKERIVQTPVESNTLPTDKNNPKTTKEVNWQFNFNTALETADKSLIGDTDQIVYRSFKNLAFMFWYKNFGQGISDTEMHFIKKSKKMHGVSISMNLNTPIPILEILAKDSNEDVRSSVAKNPKTPTPVLELLAKDGVYFLTSVAKNPNIPTSVLVTLASVLKLLAKDEDSSVRCRVAENPKSPTSVLELLAKDEDEDVRRRVAENTNTPTSVLELLAKDENSSVRSSVAENPKTPTSVLKLLAKDEDERVRSEVAKSPITPIDSLMELLLEPYLEDSKAKEKIISAFGDVNTVAELRAEYLKKLCAGLIPSYERVYGLMLPDCPTSVLTKCAKSALWLERCAVAQNLATPVKLLQILEKDSNAIVRDAAKR